jgi:hypothetical protein
MKLTTRSAPCVAALLLSACTSGGNRHRVETAVGAVTTPRRQIDARTAPDAAFINLTYAKLQLAPGEASTVELDVINRGQDPTGPFRVAVYATLGRVVTANRTLLGSVEVSTQTNAGPQHLVIPITAPAQPGSYAIGVEVDDRRQVPGDDRDNNRSGPSQLLVR